MQQLLGAFYIAMKKYILIQNEGEIEPNSFELIGASTKRDEKGKIGFFGSGLKYSIAYMMRKNIEFKIYSGNTEFVFTTKQELLKDKTFDRICINGVPTSYTTTMGPTWTQDWFILREIYCNALDEGSCTLIPETDIIQPSEGNTRIYIELTDELKKVSSAWDAYFSNERPFIAEENNVYTCYLGSGEGHSSQKVHLFEKTDGVLFRRGVRVYHDKELMYDYGCDYIDINEDRTAKHGSVISYLIRNMVALFPCESYVKSILRECSSESPGYEYMAIGLGDVYSAFSDKWVSFSKESMLVVKDISGRYIEEITTSKKEVFLLPSLFARALKKSQPDAIVLGMSNVVGDYGFSEVAPNAKITYLLKEVVHSLMEMKYEVPFDIKVVEFDDIDVMGRADIKNKTILIAASTFDKGRREIALTIMEEVEHIKSECNDETRAFQNHLFSQWLKSMEEANGLFL